MKKMNSLSNQKYIELTKKRMLATCEILENECWIWTGYLCEPKKQYGLTSSCLDGTKKKILAHRLSFRLWKGNIPEKLFVLHSCDNPLCINPDHLHIGTPQKNMDEMRERGREKKALGEKNRHAKLTNEIVLQIRKEFKQGLTVRGISRKYKISSSSASYITRNITWKHI
jgi:hypothetical protein